MKTYAKYLFKCEGIMKAHQSILCLIVLITGLLFGCTHTPLGTYNHNIEQQSEPNQVATLEGASGSYPLVVYRIDDKRTLLTFAYGKKIKFFPGVHSIGLRYKYGFTASTTNISLTFNAKAGHKYLLGVDKEGLSWLPGQWTPWIKDAYSGETVSVAKID